MTLTYSYVKKHIRLIPISLRFSLKHASEYKVQFILNIITYIVQGGIWIFLWNVMFSDITQIAHWNEPMMYLLIGFLLISDSLWQLGYFTQQLSDDVIEGNLDAYLVRPVNTLFGLFMTRFQVMSVLPLCLGICLSLYVIITYFSLSFLPFLIAFFICLIGVGIFHLGILIIGSLVFWLGRIKTILTVYRGFNAAKGFPIDILHVSWRSLLTFFFPAIFFGTYPVLIITAFSIQTSLLIVGVGLLILLFWFMIFALIWNTGLKKYESMGG